jgi:Na+-driven multidrug efflux pump
LLRLTGWQSLLPDWRVVAEIARQGLPSSLNYMTIGLGIYVITYFVSDFGSAAVAAYGAAMRVEQIVLLPSIGLNIATLSLVAQNRGAGKPERVWEAMRAALSYGAWIMAGGTLLVLVLARPLMSFFTQDQAVIDIGTTYLRIDALVLYAYVVLFVHVAALQGVKRPMFGVWVGLFRQILVPALAFYLMIRVLDIGLLGIWWGIFGITWAAALAAAGAGRHYLKGILASDQSQGP